MGKGERIVFRGIRLAAVLASFYIGAPAQADTQPPPSARPPTTPQTVDQLSIPSSLAFIVETHPPIAASSAGRAAPLVIHIQEAHTNYDAQKNLIGVLQELVAKHGLKLIMVEGGFGDVGMAYLRGYGPLENRTRVAEKYLRLGILSGEEYLDIVSDHPLILWGVEDQALYQQNLDAFLDTESLRDTLKPALARVQQAVDALRPAIAPPALLELDAKAAAFAKRDLSLADYAGALAAAARAQQIALRQFPNLERFLDVRELESSIHPDLVQKEQQALLAQLRSRAAPGAVTELLAQAEALKAGTLKREAFYAHLDQVSSDTGIHLITYYPKVATYVRYVTLSAEINPSALAEELDRFAARLRDALASTPEAKQLQSIAGQVDLVTKLLNLEFSPEEYRRFGQFDHAGIAASWTQGLRALANQRGLPVPDVGGLEPLNDALPRLERFYTAAQQRDQALVERACAKLTETGEPLAVLITGGFHSPQITKLLMEKGLGVVVVAPKVGQATNERLYQAVLKYKSGHGSFADVEAAANVNDANREGSR